MELDALIVRSLSRLPTHAPSRVFSDKVMNRVGLPSPRAVVRYRRARAWLAEPRRALALAGAYAIIAIAAMVITVPWLVQHSPAIRFAIDWSTSRAELMARGIAMASARWAITSGIAGLLKAIPVSGRQLWAVGAGVVALYAGCAYGLHALLRTPKASHATVQA
jgi:hypothetical protein